MSKTAAPTQMVIEPIAVDLQLAAQAFGMSVSTVEKGVREGWFPKPRQLSPRRVGWLYEELKEHARSRPVSELPPPPCAGKRSKADED